MKQRFQVYLVDLAARDGDVGEYGSKGDFEEGLDIIAIKLHLVACKDLKGVCVSKSAVHAAPYQLVTYSEIHHLILHELHNPRILCIELLRQPRLSILRAADTRLECYSEDAHHFVHGLTKFVNRGGVFLVEL